VTPAHAAPLPRAHAFIRASRYFHTTAKREAWMALVIRRVPRPRPKRPKRPSFSTICFAASA
jgi:hypothetical protein